MNLREKLDSLPESIRAELEPFVDDPVWVSQKCDHYLDADDAGRADILAFHQPIIGGGGVGGPERFRQLALKDRDGTPTASELEDQV